MHREASEVKTEPGPKNASTVAEPTEGKGPSESAAPVAQSGKEGASGEGAGASSSRARSSRVDGAPWNRGMNADVEHETIKYFKSEALSAFPVHTVETFDPLQSNTNGPKRGEVWIRIKAENSREMKEVMAQVADLYREITGSMQPVTVMHWVGNRPYAKFTYEPGE
jgi:hypothetical protein